ncbi:uncharacterized protein [Bemisia tabaci]|uniref:uncharacterized protein isoform X2 n=1 Tax=Bemisia tabaci TaxID=7038 RepID=UPI0008F9D98C|nr:PREDICTED: uncharacterized protein LOC109033655 isoform X2 [Bemisia tabaci]
MSSKEEECELTQLVSFDEEPGVNNKFDDETPPHTPAEKRSSLLVLSQLTNQGTSKKSLKQNIEEPERSSQISSSEGASSTKGEPSIAESSTSRPISRIATAPVSNIGHTTRLYQVNERTGRNSSGNIISESHGYRPPRPPLPSAIRSQMMKKALLDRECQHHCFLSDVTDVRQMEQALLHLLEDFNSGKLRAFSKDCSMEQMTGIREQQEHVARLHFELFAQQELFEPLSDEGLQRGVDNMNSLMSSLEQLSISIEKLHTVNDTS